MSRGSFPPSSRPAATSIGGCQQCCEPVRTSRLPPRATADAVAASISHGQAPKGDATALALLPQAVPDAFTTALHGGLLVGGFVLLAIAVLAALFVRHQQPAAPSTPLVPERN